MDINLLLQRKNMSQYALSKNSGVPYSTISDICLGKSDIRKCNVETAYKIAQALDCSIETLINEEEIAELTNEYITIEEYYQKLLRNRKNVILYGESALDYLRLTNGGIPLMVEVYATSDLSYPFVVHKVKNFNDIEYTTIDGVMVCSVNQSINDMLSNKKTDYQALDEALGNYYYKNGETFDGLKINKKNIARFNEEKEYAIRYYDTN